MFVRVQTFGFPKTDTRESLIKEKTMHAEERETCAHGPCQCMAPGDEEYCSPYCENAAAVTETEIRCSCGHAGCR